MNHRSFRPVRLAAVAAMAVLLAAPSGPVAPAGAEILLRDDFVGAALDGDVWLVPEGPGTFFGRTQIRPPSEPPTVAGGLLWLRLDTHNPTALVAGDSFWGSEVRTVETFALADGLDFRARVRLAGDLPGGLVGALFSFGLDPVGDRRDEIDFELLSNDLVADAERVLTNVFDDDDFSQPGDKAFASIGGLALDEFHVYEVRWRPGGVQWQVDGVTVREEAATVPDEPMDVRLNIWAPDAFFVEAFDAALQPVAEAVDNETFFYEVDFVEIRRPPCPGDTLNVVEQGGDCGGWSPCLTSTQAAIDAATPGDVLRLGPGFAPSAVEVSLAAGDRLCLEAGFDASFWSRGPSVVTIGPSAALGDTVLSSLTVEGGRVRLE